MKKILIWIVLLLSLSLNIISCIYSEDLRKKQGNETIIKPSSIPEKPKRIKEIGHESILGRVFIILEIDGHEYICQIGGGIIHSESCPCKAKKE
jgi:hypothetical protein